MCAVVFPGLAQVATCDPGREHFIYNNWHFGGGDRKLHDQGLRNYIPALYHEGRVYFERYLKLDVVMIKVASMDKHGFFNFGAGNSLHATIVEGSKTVIVEVSDKMPYVYGGNEEAVHISDVDLIVGSDNQPLVQVPDAEPTAVDNQVGEQGPGKVNVTVGD